MTRPWERDGETNASDSALSGLSALDDDTDEFGRIVLQHARDEERMRRALGGHEQAFRKARPMPRIGRNLDASDQGRMGNGRDSPVETWEERRVPSAGSSNESEPPLNIPRDWGRKGRQTNGWLRRMGESDSESKRQRPATDAILQRRTALTGDDSPRIDRLAATERSRRAAQAISMSTQQSHVSLEGINSREKASSMERVNQWDSDQDFTAGSLLASTPAIPSRATRAEESRRRELIGIESRDIARERLERLGARKSSGAFQRRPSARMSDAFDDEPGDSRSALLPQRRQVGFSMQSNKENVPFGANRIIRSVESKVTEMERYIDTQAAEAPINGGAKNDSLALLQGLARGLSKSPSPGPESNTALEGGVSVRTTTQAQRQRQASGQAPEVVVTSHGPEVITQTPAQDRGRTLAKTPIVTGAWIDTPRGPTSNTPNGHSRLGIQPFSRHIRTQSEPAKPSSALADLVRSARAHPSEAAFGDDTIASLEGLLDPTLQFTDHLDLTAKRANRDPATPSTQADGGGDGTSLQSADSLNRHLKAARTSIKVAKAGLRDFERDIDAVALVEERPGEDLKGRGTEVCQACGRPGSVYRSLRRETLHLFYDLDSAHGSRLKRLTWTGTICAIAASWLVLESILAYVLTPPRFATTMQGYGVDPDAPRWPLVIPTLLFRPFRWLLAPLLQLTTWTIASLWSAMTDSSSDSTRGALGKSKLATIGNHRIAAQPEPIRRNFRAGQEDWFDDSYGQEKVWEERKMPERRSREAYMDDFESSTVSVSSYVAPRRAATTTTRLAHKYNGDHEEEVRATAQARSGFRLGNIKWWGSTKDSSTGEAWDDGVLMQGSEYGSQRGVWDYGDTMGDDDYV